LPEIFVNEGGLALQDRGAASAGPWNRDCAQVFIPRVHRHHDTRLLIFFLFSVWIAVPSLAVAGIRKPCGLDLGPHCRSSTFLVLFLFWR
jgi:hypothetical protein